MKIVIAGDAYMAEWLLDPDNASAQRILAAAYRKIAPRCGCTPRQPELYIFFRKDSKRYFVARKAHSGELHAPWCEFHGDGEDGDDSSRKPAIQVGDNGVNIRVASVLERRLPGDGEGKKVERAVEKNEPAAGRNELSLRGLLQYLWDRGRLNRWYPAIRFNRTMGTVQRALAVAGEDVEINRQRLTQMLVVPTKQQEETLEAAIARNGQRLRERTAQHTRACLVVGRMMQWLEVRASGSAGLKLSLLDDVLWMDKPLAKALAQSFAREIAALRNRETPVIAVAVVFRDGKYYRVGDAGLMQVNAQFIPCDSSYEIQVADRLVAEQRTFMKPVVRQGADVHPDFFLLDTETPCVMEVFGIVDDPDYLANKARKIDYYRRERMPLWQWEAADGGPMPAFPPKVPDRKAN